MKKILAMVAIILLVSVPAIAQEIDYCEGNFDYDEDVDGADAAVFKEDFGRSTFKNPCPPPNPAPALVPKTGLTLCYDYYDEPRDCAGRGEDAEYQKGVAWPNPRFTGNSDGTVTDNLTGLVWLKNANCFGQRTWEQALSDCNGLSDGSCGLTDGSSIGDWRLPNRFELESLLGLNYYHPTLSNTTGTGRWSEGDPFDNVETDWYWSSTYWVANVSLVWYVHIGAGQNSAADRMSDNFVWPVRDPL